MPDEYKDNDFIRRAILEGEFGCLSGKQWDCAQHMATVDDIKNRPIAM